MMKMAETNDELDVISMTTTSTTIPQITTTTIPENSDLDVANNYDEKMCEIVETNDDEDTEQIDELVNNQTEEQTLELTNEDIMMKEEIEDDKILNVNNVQEDAVEQFLSSACLKDEFNEDSMPSIVKTRIVDFKSDNVLDFSDDHDDDNNIMVKKIYPKRKYTLARALMKRSIKILNKMHVMEEVREGCDTQPSSPGHAEQRSTDIDEQVVKENGSIETTEMCNDDDDDGGGGGGNDIEKIDEEQINVKNHDVNDDDDNDEDVTKCKTIEKKSIVIINNDDEECEKKDIINDENVIVQETDDIDNNHHHHQNIDEETSNDSSIQQIESNSKRKPCDVDQDSNENGNSNNNNNNGSGNNKKLKTDIEVNFNMRDKIFQQYIETTGCNNLEQIHLQTEQLLAEVRTLNELAKDKEKEWNNIIHMKKMKEELLLRLQRQKQILMMNDKSDMCDVDMIESPLIDYHDDRQQSILKTKMNNNNNNHNVQKANNSNKGHLQSSGGNKRNYYNKNYQNTLANHQELNGGQQNRQRNVVDVQSIIADYRQRHPETVPRRGRRIRSVLNANSIENGGSNKMGILNFSNLALGSGSQVRQNVGSMADPSINAEMSLLINPMDGLKGVVSSSEYYYGRRSRDVSFKDMLVQCAKLSQNERHHHHQQHHLHHLQDGQNQTQTKSGGFPEVTVHPVSTPSPQPSNSLLHGILTKSQSKTDNSKTTFSPTLARLLTAPERSAAASTNATLMNNPNVSISDILSCSKARNEITITPVGNQYETVPKGKNTDEDEADDSVDRLVIDEGSEVIDARTRTDTSSDAGDEVPQCQGCNQKAAQFVCAGCGNQWYCSRECQVAAWDEHSEVCSG